MSRSSEPAETQTVESIGIEKIEQTSESKDVEVQTDGIQEPMMCSNYDENALSAFLSRVGQKIIDEIDKGNRSKAFLSYQLPDEEDSSTEVKNVLSLIRPKSDDKNEMKVNALAWSCTGGVVALALGHPNHVDWCSHSGVLHFYNIAYSQNSSVEPSRAIETTSCVTCVAFHPYEPSYVACGLVRGNIAIWNLQHEGSECLITCNAHNDPVTDVVWMQYGGTRPNLVSSGQDGRLMIWNVSLLTGTCTVQENFAFNDVESDVEAGISCFAFCSRRSEQFVVALEGGALKLCNSSSARPTTRISNTVPVKNPVVGDLERHNGVVSCVAFSPYHEELLLTVGSDNRILVHSVVKMDVIREIQCDIDLTGAAWCLSQANLFVVCNAKAGIGVYDYKNGRQLADFSTDVSTISVARLNLKSPKYLAVSNADGKAYILEMPQYFQTGEI